MHRQAMSTARCRVAGHSARPGERITVPAHCRLVLTASGCWLKETVSLLRRTCSCFKFCSLTFQTFLFVSAGPGAGWKRLQQLEETNWKCQDVWRSSGSGRERLQVSMGCKSWGRIWQKTTKFWKAIILQLKNKLKKKGDCGKWPADISWSRCAAQLLAVFFSSAAVSYQAFALGAVGECLPCDGNCVCHRGLVTLPAEGVESDLAPVGAHPHQVKWVTHRPELKCSFQSLKAFCAKIKS